MIKKSTVSLENTAARRMLMFNRFSVVIQKILQLRLQRWRLSSQVDQLFEASTLRFGDFRILWKVSIFQQDAEIDKRRAEPPID